MAIFDVLMMPRGGREFVGLQSSGAPRLRRPISILMEARRIDKDFPHLPAVPLEADTEGIQQASRSEPPLGRNAKGVSNRLCSL